MLAFAAFALPWMMESGCVPKGACLRNTDCPKDQACVQGACAYKSVTYVVADADGSTEPTGTGGDGAGGVDGAGGSGSGGSPEKTDSGSSVSVDAGGDVTPLTDR